MIHGAFYHTRGLLLSCFHKSKPIDATGRQARVHTSAPHTNAQAVVAQPHRTVPSPWSHTPLLQPPVTELKALGQLDNTYVVFSSDNGYHLGSFGLSEGKALPIEEDIRVPFYIRGPGLGAGQQVAQPGSFVDVAPTVMALAGE